MCVPRSSMGKGVLKYPWGDWLKVHLHLGICSFILLLTQTRPGMGLQNQTQLLVLCTPAPLRLVWEWYVWTVSWVSSGSGHITEAASSKLDWLGLEVWDHTHLLLELFKLMSQAALGPWAGWAGFFYLTSIGRCQYTHGRVCSFSGVGDCAGRPFLGSASYTKESCSVNTHAPPTHPPKDKQCMSLGMPLVWMFSTSTIPTMLGVCVLQNILCT